MSSSSLSFYVTGGTLRLDAACYLERQADRDLFESLLQGEFCYVLTSRQMGKSSLMVRTANKLRSQGTHVIALDLSAIGQNLTPAQWYNGLLTSMGDQLGLEDELEQFWIDNERLGPVQRWFASIRKAVLGWRPGKVVIFLDEIDSVRSLPFSTDEFFAAIRECYNRRSEDPEFSRLAFCLLGVATPSDLIRDTRVTPFNIGRRIELNDFTAQEAEPLSKGLHTDGAPRESILLRRVLYWTSGHPYLTQRLCQALARDKHARRPSDVDRLCEELFFSSRARERDDNLIFVRERLLRTEGDLASLLGLYLKIRSGERVADDETNPLVGILRLSGIVRSEQGRLIERNLLYYRVFDRAWAKANLPDADLRRQHAAFRRGVVRTGSVALCIVVLMGLMVLIALREKRGANLASARAFVSQAEATLVSGHHGQRFESLDAIRNASADYADKSKLRNLAIATMALADLKPDRNWAGYGSETPCVAFNGNLDRYARGDLQGNITVRSADDDQELVSLRGSGLPVDALLFSPDSRYLAARYKRGSTHELIVWDWRNQAAGLTLALQTNWEAWDFSPDNKRLAIGRSDGQLRVYELETRTVSDEFPLTLPTGLARSANCVRFNPSGSMLAESCESSLNVQFWNLGPNAGTNRLKPLYHRAPVLDLAWHRDGDLLATACNSGEIYLWDLRAPQAPYKVLRGHEARVVRVAFSHQGDLLASYSADKTLRLWIPFTGRQMIYPLETDQLGDLNFDSEDRRLGFGRTGSDLQLWQVNPAREYRVLLGDVGTSEEIENMDFSPDGRYLAAASREGIILWDAVCGKKLVVLPEVSTQAAFFDPTSGALMASSSIFGLRSWSLFPANSSRESGVSLGPATDLAGLPKELGKFAVSSNGKIAAVIHADDVLLFDRTGAMDHSSLKAETYYESLVISPDGKYLAARVRQGSQIEIWDVPSRARAPNSPAFDGGEYYAFSPDANWFVTSAPNVFRFWQVGTWQSAFELKRSGREPVPIAFSSDGKLFAVADLFSTIELVQLPGGESLARLKSPDRRILRALTFSSDNRRLAASSSEQLILLWDLSLLTKGLSQLGLQGKLPVLAESPQSPAQYEQALKPATQDPSKGK